MKRKQRNIIPHEPDQPIAGMAEAISDSDAMRCVWEGKEQRAAKPTLSSSIPPKRLLSPKTRFLQENGFLKSKRNRNYVKIFYS